MALTSNVSRRSFLRALAGVSVATPFLGLFNDILAKPTATLPRFCVLSNPHGMAPTYWRPRMPDGSAAGETGWTLTFDGSTLAPLEKHKDSLILIEGLDFLTDTANPAFYTTGHNGVSVLTGMHPLGAPESDTQYMSCRSSLDVYLAQLLKTQEFLFIPTGYGGGNNTIGAFRDDGNAVIADYDLGNCLVNWFSGIGDGTDPKADAKKGAQLAVVDYLGGEAKRIRGRLAGQERAKLDAHLDAIDSIAQKINNVSLTCSKPTNVGSNGLAGNEYMPIILDFAAQLFACNLTRVINLPVDPIANAEAPWLASQDPIFQTATAHNDIAHGFRPDDDVTQRRLSILQNYYAQQVADFIDRLKSIPEGTGSVYDNTIILWVNEFGDPARHLHTNAPFVLAGGASTFKKGRYLQYSLDVEEYSMNQTPHTPLLTSVANQFGANLDVFGDPMYPGELKGL